jgi:hypothetical protein
MIPITDAATYSPAIGNQVSAPEIRPLSRCSIGFSAEFSRETLTSTTNENF